MIWTLPTFEPEYADGDRSHIGSVGVDSGTMCIASSFPLKDEWLPPSLRPCWTGRQWGASRTGFGDGEYDVLTLTRDGEAVGVEIVFLCDQFATPTVTTTGTASTRTVTTKSSHGRRGRH